MPDFIIQCPENLAFAVFAFIAKYMSRNVVRMLTGASWGRDRTVTLLLCRLFVRSKIDYCSFIMAQRQNSSWPLHSQAQSSVPVWGVLSVQVCRGSTTLYEREPFTVHLRSHAVTQRQAQARRADLSTWRWIYPANFNFTPNLMQEPV